MLANRGFSLSELGAYSEALPLLSQALAIANRMGLALVAAGAMSNLGMVHLRLGNLAEAERLERAAVAAFEARDRRQEGIARVYLALVLLEVGNRGGAVAQARTALGLLESAPPLRPYAGAALSTALLAMERATEALDAARDAALFRDGGGRVEEGDAMLRLAHARALHATGDVAAAREQIATARDRLLERAATISNPTWKQTFLENVPEHVLTFQLTNAWT